MKNDRKDNKARWDLIPLDCLNDIAEVYTADAKKYEDNSWKSLDNGYERYKGALLRHLYAAENKTLDEDTGCRHLAQVAWNAIALLWFSKHGQSIKPKTIEEIEHEKKVEDFNDVIANLENIIKADSDANAKNEKLTYKWNDKVLNRAAKNSRLKDIHITYSRLSNYDSLTEVAKQNGRYIYTITAVDPKNNDYFNEVVEYNMYKHELVNFLERYDKTQDADTSKSE